MEVTNPTNEEGLRKRWQELETDRGDLIRRCEQYSSWTLPYLFVPDSMKDREAPQAMDSLGARAVNHLSNKLVLTLFQPQAPFFRLMATSAILTSIKTDAQNNNQDAKELLAMVDQKCVEAERDAMRALDYNKYRTEATMASKYLIVSGNALMYHPEDNGPVQVYSVKDYCIVRDLSGAMIELITRDMKALSTFKQEVQDAIKAGKGTHKPTSNITIYTQIKLQDDGKFHLTQYADDVKLDSQGAWTREDLPWIPLTWNLTRGANYGRGLVEDYAFAFHALTILTSSYVTLVAIASDIKFLVKPSSMLNVTELNNSASGTYHQGEEGDVTAVQLDKAMDAQLTADYIERITRQISQAFLLNSAVQRDAERVTAEEIRYVAQELELSHGGIYSRMADEWQLPTAKLILKKIHIDLGSGKTFYPQIITGLDSLSRAGDMENLRLLFQDLQLTNGLPDAVLAAIDMQGLIAYCGVRRGVEYDKFVKTKEQQAAEQQAAMEQQQEMLGAEAGAKAIGSAAGKATSEE